MASMYITSLRGGMMQIIIHEEECWMCGKAFSSEDKKTMHHVLPQCLKPAKNVLVPLHESCHEKITSQDISSLTQFASKLHKELELTNTRVGKLVAMLKY
jgi:5-methylcytosine-specific restriction endonuclease McrA